MSLFTSSGVSIHRLSSSPLFKTFLGLHVLAHNVVGYIQITVHNCQSVKKQAVDENSLIGCILIYGLSEEVNMSIKILNIHNALIARRQFLPCNILNLCANQKLVLKKGNNPYLHLTNFDLAAKQLQFIFTIHI